VVVNLMRHDSVDDAHLAEAQAFRPELWLGEDVLSPGSAKRISMPFGLGPRIRPGHYLVPQEMKIVLLTLLNHFDIESVGTADVSEPA
jgi:cytochrome P450